MCGKGSPLLAHQDLLRRVHCPPVSLLYSLRKAEDQLHRLASLVLRLVCAIRLLLS